MEGWIKLHRAISEHWIYRDAEYLKIWIEMLLRARFDDQAVVELQDGQVIELRRGEFIFGRKKWSQRLGIPERRLRTFIDRLLKDDLLELKKSTNKFSIYRIIDTEYNEFPNICSPESRQKLAGISPEIGHQSDQQSDQQNRQQKPAPLQGGTEFCDQQSDQQNRQQSDQQTTSRRPADDQQATTKEELKEFRELEELKEKDIKDTLSIEENDFGKIYDLLLRNFHQPNQFQIEDINEYLKQGMEYGVFEEAVKKTRIENKNIGNVFAILKNCSYRHIKTRQQFNEDQLQFHQAQQQKQNRARGQYAKPIKPTIPIVERNLEPEKVSEDELERARELARRLDAARGMGKRTG